MCLTSDTELQLTQRSSQATPGVLSPVPCALCYPAEGTLGQELGHKKPTSFRSTQGQGSLLPMWRSSSCLEPGLALFSYFSLTTHHPWLFALSNVSSQCLVPRPHDGLSLMYIGGQVTPAEGPRHTQPIWLHR